MLLKGEAPDANKKYSNIELEDIDENQEFEQLETDQIKASNYCPPMILSSANPISKVAMKTSLWQMYQAKNR